MPLCNKCIADVVQKLTPNDIYTLHELKDRPNAQTGMSRDEMLSDLKDNLSVFQLSQALMRLELVGFVQSLKVGKGLVYYITSNGLAVLNYLASR